MTSVVAVLATNPRCFFSRLKSGYRLGHLAPGWEICLRAPQVAGQSWRDEQPGESVVNLESAGLSSSDFSEPRYNQRANRNVM